MMINTHRLFHLVFNQQFSNLNVCQNSPIVTQGLNVESFDETISRIVIYFTRLKRFDLIV